MHGARTDISLSFSEATDQRPGISSSHLQAADAIRSGRRREQLAQSALSSGRQLTFNHRLHLRKYNSKNSAMRISGSGDELTSVTLDDHPANG